MALLHLVVLGAASAMEFGDLSVGESGIQNGEFIDAAIEIANGEPWRFPKGLSPVANLPIPDAERLHHELGLDDLLRKLLAIDVV